LVLAEHLGHAFSESEARHHEERRLRRSFEIARELGNAPVIAPRRLRDDRDIRSPLCNRKQKKWRTLPACVIPLRSPVPGLRSLLPCPLSPVPSPPSPVRLALNCSSVAAASRPSSRSSILVAASNRARSSSTVRKSLSGGR